VPADPVAQVSGYLPVRRLLRSPGLSPRRPGWATPAASETERAIRDRFSRWLLFSDGEYHRRLRRHLAGAFRPAAAAAGPVTQRHLTGLLRRADLAATFSWLDDVAAPLGVALVGLTVGASPAEAGRLVDWSLAIVHHMSTVVNEEGRMRRALGAMTAIDDWLAGQWSAAGPGRRPARPGGLPVALAAIAADPHLGPAAATAVLAQTVTGAYDPTVAAVAALGLHATPTALTTLRPQRLADEVLRIASPIRYARRFHADTAGSMSTPDCPHGGRLMLGLAEANLDPVSFPDPTRPRADRPPHLAFGAGRHHCPGAEVVRACLAAAAGVLARHRVRFVQTRVRTAPEPGILRYLAVDGHWEPF
jgi:cytochrome P450